MVLSICILSAQSTSIFADNFSRVVSRVLEKAKAIEESLQYDGGEADACAGEIDEQELHKRCLPLEDIKALNVEAMRVHPTYSSVLLCSGAKF
jgi:predicted transcriptional regulator